MIIPEYFIKNAKCDESMVFSRAILTYSYAL